MKSPPVTGLQPPFHAARISESPGPGVKQDYVGEEGHAGSRNLRAAVDPPVDNMMWGRDKIGVPQQLDGVSWKKIHKKLMIWGYPHFKQPPYDFNHL